MSNVDKNTRAGNDGKRIICPSCDASSTVYHFAWSALSCDVCHSDVDKYDWIVSPKRKEYKFTLNHEYRRPSDRPYGQIGDAPLRDILLDVLEELDSRGVLGFALKAVEGRDK